MLAVDRPSAIEASAGDEPPRGVLDPAWVAAVAATGLLVLALLYTLAIAQSFLMPIVAAGVLALILNPIARQLTGLGLKPAVAAGLIVVGLIGVGAVSTISLAPAAAEWSQRLPVVIRQVERKLAGLKSSLEAVEEVSQKVDEATQLGDAGDEEPQAVVIESAGVLSTVALSAPGILLQVMLVTAVTFFALMERSVIRRTIMSTGRTFRSRLRVARMCRDVRRNVGVFLLSAALINAGLAVFTGLLVHVVGLPNPVLWGVAMGFLNFIPFIGPAFMMIMLLLVGLVSFPTIGEALVAPGGLLLLNIVESQVVTPMVLGRRLLASPLAVFLAVGFGGWLWGVVGALIAVPLLILAITVGRHIASISALRATTMPRLKTGRRAAG